MNIGKKEARRLLDALIHLRRAVAIAQTGPIAVAQVVDVSQLALERCIEIADEALQRGNSSALAQMDEPLVLNLSKLRYLISRDYHQVDPQVCAKPSYRWGPVLSAILNDRKTNFTTWRS